jgi:hypothetical protein
MGTIVYRATKAQAVQDELRSIASHATLFAHRVIGSRLWYLAAHRSGSLSDLAGSKWIGLTLIECRNGEAAVKSMDETCGPCYYDCPLSLLDRADAPYGEFAGPWRAKVRAFHAMQATRKATMEEGVRIDYGGTVYVLRLCLGRRGWEVEREDDGLTFRLKAMQVNASTVLPALMPQAVRPPTSPMPRSAVAQVDSAASSPTSFTSPTPSALQAPQPESPS